VGGSDLPCQVASTFTDRAQQLAADIAGLRALRAAEAARSETEQQMEALKSELLSLLDQPTGGSFH